MSGLNNTNKIVDVKCNLQIDEIQIAYDLEANLTDTYHTATGTYFVKNMEWVVRVSFDCDKLSCFEFIIIILF